MSTEFDEKCDVFAGCTPSKIKNVWPEEMFQNIYEKTEMERCEWRGIPLQKLKSFKQKELYPPVRPSDYHTVLFKIPVTEECVPDPHPQKPVDVWDKDHVRLPHSSQCLSPISKTELRSRWDLILEAYSRPISSSQQLEKAILHYNSNYAGRWNFDTLHYFFSTTLEVEESDYFFSNILPGIVQLAVSLPDQVTCGLPLLRSHRTHSVSLSQHQIAILLANAFLCTFPRRNTVKAASEYRNYPDINFIRLFGFGVQGESTQEKLKCLINYFRRVTSQCPTGTVTFSRHHVPGSRLPVWRESNASLPELHVTSTGSIEDEGSGMIQLDFANKFVGGGVLGRGCIQEEIRFVICPELIIARLFTECLDDTEALIVTGVERFNQYVGYGSSFSWAGDAKDDTPRDSFGRRRCVLVAVDAFNFQKAEEQYSPQHINRELNKAYAGFSWGLSSTSSSFSTSRLCVATGNWGCGAFGGDAYLKALLQLMAAGQAGRGVAYFTFGDPDLRDKLANMHRFLTDNSVTVGRLWRLLSSYYHRRSNGNKADLYDYLYRTVSTGQGTSQQTPQTSVIPETIVKAITPNGSDKKIGLTEEEIALALAATDDTKNCVTSSEEHNQIDTSITGESSRSHSPKPMEVKTCSVETKEGREICLQRQQDSWTRIEVSKSDMIETENSPQPMDLDRSTSSVSEGGRTVSKRKISDYFVPVTKS